MGFSPMVCFYFARPTSKQQQKRTHKVRKFSEDELIWLFSIYWHSVVSFNQVCIQPIVHCFCVGKLQMPTEALTTDIDILPMHNL